MFFIIQKVDLEGHVGDIGIKLLREDGPEMLEVESRVDAQFDDSVDVGELQLQTNFLV